MDTDAAQLSDPRRLPAARPAAGWRCPRPPAPARTGTRGGADRHTQLGIKRVVGHRELLAACVFLDPRLTRGLPPALSAATGMDAPHSSPGGAVLAAYHPMSAGIALKACAWSAAPGKRRARRQRPRRPEGMMVASASAAVAFQKGLGGSTPWPPPAGRSPSPAPRPAERRAAAPTFCWPTARR